MKNLLLTLALNVFYCTAQSQTSCDCDFKTTLGMHYNYYKGMNGVGLEYGKTGDESNFSIHVGVDMFFPAKASGGKHQIDGDTVMTGRMYNKIGYRILRIPYQFSTYIDVFGGLDMNMGVFYGVGIKILRPFNENAISIEPIYIPGKKGGWNLQATFHFKIQ
jgi:hypothetical protein